MKILIMGGSKCGKSSFAEEKAIEHSRGSKVYYLATMKVSDEEDISIVNDHLKKREGKDFVTIERQRDIGELTDDIDSKATILLECLSNLLANEIFNNDIISTNSKLNDKIINKIISDIDKLSSCCNNFIAVTYNVFNEPMHYDDSVVSYIKALGKINQILAKDFDEVYEVVAGIPLRIK